MDAKSTTVFVWDTFRLFPPARTMADANAFPASAVQLLEAQLGGHLPMEWPTAKAAGFMFAHGLELFLKAAILQAGGTPTKTHDLEQLYRTYRNLYPGKRFDLPGGIEGFVGENKKNPFPDFLKYPEEIEEIGSTWDASTHVDVADWYDRISAFGKELPRLWSDITARFGGGRNDASA